MARSCTVCGKRAYSDFCVQHKPRKPIAVSKRPKQQSDKEKDYQKWKEEVARPALIERYGNFCSCCGRPAKAGEKLDIDHIENKGSHPELKRELSNLQLLCRVPCHFRKTNNLLCFHNSF